MQHLTVSPVRFESISMATGGMDRTGKPDMMMASARAGITTAMDGGTGKAGGTEDGTIDYF